YDDYEGEIDIYRYKRKGFTTPLPSFTPEYVDYAGELDLKFVHPTRPFNDYVDYEGIVDIGLNRKTKSRTFEELDDYIDYEGEIDFIRRPVHLRNRPHYRKVRLPSEVVNFYEPIIVILEDGSYLCKSHINVEKLLLGLEDLKLKLPWLEDIDILEPNIVYLQQEDKVQPYITDKRHLKNHLLGDYIASQDWKFKEPDHRVIRIVKSWRRPSLGTPKQVEIPDKRAIHPKFRKPYPGVGSSISFPKKVWKYIKNLFYPDQESEVPSQPLPQNILNYLKGLIPESMLGKTNDRIPELDNSGVGKTEAKSSIEKPPQKTDIDSHKLPKRNKDFPPDAQSYRPSKANLKLPKNDVPKDSYDSPEYNYKDHNIPNLNPRFNNKQNNILNLPQNKVPRYRVRNPKVDFVKNENPFYKTKSKLQPENNYIPNSRFNFKNNKPSFKELPNTKRQPGNIPYNKINLQDNKITDYGQDLSSNNKWNKKYDTENYNPGISYSDNVNDYLDTWSYPSE
ncbi:hypothetical protein C0J52_27927, partial [Blattella germanica]